MIEAAKKISELVSSLADETEKNGNVSVEIITAMKKAGIFDMCRPKSLNGLESHPMETLDVIDIIAQGDGSAAWVVMVCAATAIMAGYLDEHNAENIFGEDAVVTCGVTAPNGRAVRVEGGIEVTGRWQWGSAGTHADWMLGGTLLVDDNGQILKDDDGRVFHLLPFFSKDQVEILDTWHVHGMAGSGSNDFCVDSVFVPEGRWIRFGVDQPRMNGLYQFPLLGLLGLGVSSVSLGLARRAIDELVKLAGGKVPVASFKTLANRAYVQSAVAEAEAALRSAKALMREAVNDAWAAAQKGEPLTVDHRALLRLATTNASRQATLAVDLMYNAAGGSSVFKSSPLSRIFRDAHVATQHIMVGPPTYELVGRVLLGMETDTSAL
ncbi:MAG: alkylation response protein AidB-like acyl-CoA dehydrogenase [Oceanicoccus sp.]|jgi:alkylation response protein AidB-like acyl-CoA dehydrogenase